ncbi:MAG: hypothetical protein ACD_28C00151G0021 [uncultured bacterium]|nr:MAG: hypothetical protein ACD_28C00151G0021 [uncultured bacterium]KKT77069.1 MAG: Cellulosome-anchoring protein [Candidatus Peregrinibacteria bacterium GW2011_GWA2_44_7]
MKNISKFTILVLLVFALPLQAFATTFDDVSSSHENYLGIEYLVSIGTLQGYDDGTYKPDQTVNRVELMKILVAGQGIEPDEIIYQGCFPDVTTQWFARYVCYAKEKGWVEGYEDGTFKPAQVVNRVEASKMVVGAYGFAPVMESMTENFADVLPADWFYGYVSALRYVGVIEFDADNYYPANEMTRGLIAEYIFRVLVSNENDEEIYTEEYRNAFLNDAGLSSLLDEVNGEVGSIDSGGVEITFVLYDGEVPDVESDEYVEVTNNSSETVDLEGWSIRGSSGEESYIFTSIALIPGESIKVYTNQGKYSFNSAKALWNNAGEEVYLYGADGVIVDQYQY